MICYKYFWRCFSHNGRGKIISPSYPQWFEIHSYKTLDHNIVLLRQASHCTFFCVRCFRSDTLWNDGSSQKIVSFDWNRDPCLAIHPLTLHDWFLAIVCFWDKTQSLRNFWTCSKCYDGMRWFPPIVRTVTDGIARGWHYTRYRDDVGVVGGGIAGRRKLKM